MEITICLKMRIAKGRKDLRHGQNFGGLSAGSEQAGGDFSAFCYVS